MSADPISHSTSLLFKPHKAHRSAAVLLIASHIHFEFAVLLQNVTDLIRVRDTLFCFTWICSVIAHEDHWCEWGALRIKSNIQQVFNSSKSRRSSRVALCGSFLRLYIASLLTRLTCDFLKSEKLSELSNSL